MSLNALSHSLQCHQRVLVAFSGGLDSTVLLHQLVTLRERRSDIELRAIHIHHGLSAHADSWVEHCQQVCQQWLVPLEIARVTLPQRGLGVEAHAREARYDAFRSALRPEEVLVTAQHLNDQCETLLLALKRGSGPAGLSAMDTESEFAGTRLLRPLLNTSRQQLLEWAITHQLRWIEDESNQDDSYDRNFLRLRVIPQLSERWPHFAQAVARSAALCGEQEQLLDELLAEQLSALIGSEGQLAIPPLRVMSPVRRAALIRRWLALQHALMPSRDHLTRIWQEVALAREDASPALRMGSFEVRRYQQQLWWVKHSLSQASTCVLWQDITRPLPLPTMQAKLLLTTGTEIRRPAQNERVTVRFRAEGNIHIVGRKGGRKLKKIWQELGVAPWLRDATPLLFYGETLIVAAGYFVTKEGQCRAGEEGMQLLVEQDGQ